MVLKSLVLLNIFIITSCGKEIINSNGSDRVGTTDLLQSSTIGLDLSLDYTDKTSNVYLDNSGWAKVPNSPIIRSSNSDYVLTQVLFNTNNDTGSIDIYDYDAVICEYFSLKNQKTNSGSYPNYTHSFNGCYYYLNGTRQELNYQPGQEIAIDRGRYLLITAHSSSPDEVTQLSVDIEVDWH